MRVSRFVDLTAQIVHVGYFPSIRREYALESAALPMAALITALSVLGIALDAASDAAITAITKSLDAVGCSALLSEDRPSSIASRNVRSRMRRFATRANVRARQRRTSAPSRAGTLVCRAAGLLRRQRYGPGARLMHHPQPSRFRRLRVERLACAAGHPGDFDASRSDTANHPRPLSPRPADSASASRASAGALRTTNRLFSSFPVPLSLRSYREHSAKPLDNLRHIHEHQLRTRARRAPITRMPRYGLTRSNAVRRSSSEW